LERGCVQFGTWVALALSIRTIRPLEFANWVRMRGRAAVGVAVGRRRISSVSVCAGAVQSGGPSLLRLAPRAAHHAHHGPYLHSHSIYRFTSPPSTCPSWPLGRPFGRLASFDTIVFIHGLHSFNRFNHVC